MFNLSCDWKSGFVMDPLKKQRVGYLTKLEGIVDLKPTPDITVFSPFNEEPSFKGLVKSAGTASASSIMKVDVVGVIDNLSWGGGVGDPICISAYVSQQTAQQIQVKQQATLKSTAVSSLVWWIGNYDEEMKKWFEEAHPIADTGITGQINAQGSDVRLAVANEPTKVASNIDVNVFSLYFEVVPAADATYDLHFATSNTMKFVKAWGLKIGTQAKVT